MMILKDIMPILALVAGLQAKHFVCDGPLQTKAMVDAKSHYGAWLGIVHSGVHAIGTAVVFLIAGYSVALFLGLGALDFVLHYHVDYTKENIVKHFKWGFADAKFWWALTADQCLHHFTYLILAALALTI